MPLPRAQQARTPATTSPPRPRPVRATARRAAQLTSVLVLGATTAALAWAGSAAEPGPVAEPDPVPVVLSTPPATPSTPSTPTALAAPSEVPAEAAPALPPDVADDVTTTAGTTSTAGTTGATVPPGRPGTTRPDGPAGGAALVPPAAAAPAPGDPGDGDGARPDGAAASPGPSSAAGSPAARPLSEVLGSGSTSPSTRTLRRPAEPAHLDLMQRSTDDPASTWVVVNKARPLVPAGYEPADLVTVQGYQVRSSVQEPLTALLAAAAADGVQLGIRSAYRSAGYQEEVYRSWTEQLGAARADEVSARAGHSEHQTGLAVDIGSTTRPECDFEDCFDTTAEGAWVAAHAREFGFLVRYTAANQDVTGFAPEGWHLRYVGTDLVAELERQGVTTLEELFGLPGGPDYG